MFYSSTVELTSVRSNYKDVVRIVYSPKQSDDIRYIYPNTFFCKSVGDIRCVYDDIDDYMDVSVHTETPSIAHELAGIPVLIVVHI
jgi:hypothetical protein